MAYFDSEKNKALWSKRLAQLEKEKEQRKLNGYKPTNRMQDSTRRSPEDTLGPGVRIISLEQLIAKEERRHKMKLQAERAARQRQAVAQAERLAQQNQTGREAPPVRPAQAEKAAAPARSAGASQGTRR